MHQLLHYFLFLLKSTNRHGIHSPFAYSLVTKCFNAKSDKETTLAIKHHRNSLLKNQKKIEITNLGAGSKTFKTNRRTIGNIAKRAGTPLKRALLLNRLVSYLNAKTGLELGTSVGLASAAMAIGNTIKLTTLEGCPQTAQTANENLSTLKNTTVKVVNIDFEAYLNHLNENTVFDLVFVDGNHKKKPTLLYFEKLLNHIHNNSVIIFDDIYWSKEMTEAWKTIKTHKKVTVSIDLFFWGMVFFRKEQQKQHFNIRV